MSRIIVNRNRKYSYLYFNTFNSWFVIDIYFRAGCNLTKQLCQINIVTHTTTSIRTYVRTYVRTYFFFFSHTWYHLLSSPIFFSLPPTRNSDPGSHCRLFSPPPATARAFIFIARRFLRFLSSSTRIELCLHTLQGTVWVDTVGTYQAIPKTII